MRKMTTVCSTIIWHHNRPSVEIENVKKRPQNLGVARFREERD